MLFWSEFENEKTIFQVNNIEILLSFGDLEYPIFEHLK